MESYRVEKLANQQIHLLDIDGQVDPAPIGDIAAWQEAEKDVLSNIVRMFNDLVGDIDWTDEDRIRQFVTETVPDKISTDARVVSAFTHSDEQNRRKEVEEALKKAINAASFDHLELYKNFTANESFKNQIHQIVYDAVVAKLGVHVPSNQ
jgi:type I restriction enzyme R subunit